MYFLLGVLLSALFQRYVSTEAMTALFGGNEALGGGVNGRHHRRSPLRLRRRHHPAFAAVAVGRHERWQRGFLTCSRGLPQRSPIWARWISTGETGSNYLHPELIGEFVQAVDGTIVECNTAYGGQRASTAMHYQLAEDHGYTAIAGVDIMDENGSMTLPVEGGTVISENYVDANLANYDFLVVLSHFKGHAMAGFGGALKNLSIGCASSNGKAWIHSGGTGGSMWGGEQDAFLEAMAEAAKSVVDCFGNGERALYINVMNRLSVDCDCDGSPAEPDMHDIGILASTDPVALDQACIDLVYAAEDGASLIQRIESRNGLHTLEHAAEIGFGSREYTLVNIGE